jgi:V/A-type H+-transporting ATPase subunit I
MLRPEEMTRAVVVGSIDSLDPTIECLYGLGILHLIDFTEQDEEFKIGLPLGKASSASQSLLKLRSMMRSLNLEGHKPSEQVPVGNIERKLEQALVNLDLNASTKAESKQRILSLIREKEAEIRALEPISSFAIPLELYEGYEGLAVFVGTCRSNPSDALASRIRDHDLSIAARKSDFAIALFTTAEDAPTASKVLIDHGFQETKLPKLTGVPSEVMKKHRADIADLEKDLDRIEKDLETIRHEFADFIVASEEHLSIEVMKAETPLRIATTANSFVIDGWIPSARAKELQTALNSLCCGLAFVETLPTEKGDDPPVLLKNPRPVRPFEFFIDLVSTPKYDEIDPTIVLFLTFPLFFGFMIGDLGFGLGLASLGAFMRFRLKNFPDLQKLGTIVLAGGIMASLFGLFVFAEAFGVPFHPPEAHPEEHSWESVAYIPIHPILDKMADIMEMLAISLLAGWVHLTLGFVLGFVNHIHHDRKHAFAKVAWLLILLGLFVEIMHIAGGATWTSAFVNDTILAWAPDAGTTIVGIQVSFTALALIIIGVVGLPLTEGAMALSEVIGLFTNLVSYTRLAALAVGKGAMALAFNTMLLPLIFDSDSIVLVIAGVLALFVTQMFFVFFLGALSAGIQAVRLNYVEFFLKFFEGGGKEFSPLKYLRKHSVAAK